jgi:hypothetical protein
MAPLSELILALQADEFVVLLVAGEYQGRSSIPERESAGLDDGLELEDDRRGEQRIEIGKIHCLFTVIHCS